MHQKEGKDQLYSVLLGRRTWKGCTADEVRDSIFGCPCCGSKDGDSLLKDHEEMPCDWPEAKFDMADSAAVN
jgi:hypothetical protein